MLEAFKNTLPLLMLENPYKPINQLGSAEGWNNPESWGVSENFLNAATVWQAYLGNAGMLFTLRLLEAIELPSPDDILLSETGFRMWEGTHPINPLQDNQHDSITIPEAVVLLKEWATLWRTVDTPGTPYVSTYVEQSKWQAYSSNVGAAIGKCIDPQGYIWRSPARRCVSATSGAYFATMFPNISGFDKYECVRSLFHLGFFPSIAVTGEATKLCLHVGEKAEVVWEENTFDPPQ
jgi:hypothetical protein